MHRPNRGRILQEFWIPITDERVDVVEVNGRLVAFEIKSGSDDLSRLPRQLNAFSKLFEEIIIVCDPRHTSGVLDSAQPWCGVVEAARTQEAAIQLSVLRHPQANPQPDPELQLRLLWREELVPVVRGLGFKPKVLRRPELQEIIFREYSAAQVSDLVRDRLRERDLSRRRW
jgi:hypothetical protein